MNLLWHSKWRTNFLKNTFMHPGGVVLKVKESQFNLGAPLPTGYNVDALVHYLKEARDLYSVLLDGFPLTNLRGLWYGLKGVQTKAQLGEVCFERLLDENGKLISCRVHGSNLSQAEAIWYLAQCMALGILLPSKGVYQQTDPSQVEPLDAAIARDLPLVAMQLHTALNMKGYISRFPAGEGQKNFLVNFDGLAQLMHRRGDRGAATAGSSPAVPFPTAV